MDKKGPLVQTSTPKSKVQRTTPRRSQQPSNTRSHIQYEIHSHVFVPGQVQRLTRHQGAYHENVQGNNLGNQSGTCSPSQNHGDTRNGSMPSWNHVQRLETILPRMENTQHNCDRSFNFLQQDTNAPGPRSPLQPGQGDSPYTLTQPNNYHSETHHQYYRKTRSSDAGHKHPDLCIRNQGNGHGFSANDVASPKIDSFLCRIPRKVACNSRAEKSNNHFHGNHSTDSRENVNGNLNNGVHSANVINRDSGKYRGDGDMYTECDEVVKCSEREVLVNEINDEPNFSISQLDFHDDTMDPDQVELSRQILRIAKVQKRLLDIHVELDSLNEQDRHVTIGDSKLEWDLSKISQLEECRGVDDILGRGCKEISEESLKNGDTSPRSYIPYPKTGKLKSPVKQRIDLVQLELNSLHKDLESSKSHVQSDFGEQTSKVLSENGCDSVCADVKSLPRTYRTQSFGSKDSTGLCSEGNLEYRMSPQYLESELVSKVAQGVHCQSCSAITQEHESRFINSSLKVERYQQPVSVTFSDPGIRCFHNQEDRKVQLHQRPLNTSKDLVARSLSTSPVSSLLTSPLEGSTSERNFRKTEMDTSTTVSSQDGANFIKAKEPDSSRQRNSSFFSPHGFSSASAIKHLPDNKSDAARQSRPQCPTRPAVDMVYMNNEARSPLGGAGRSSSQTLQTDSNNQFVDSQTHHTHRNLLVSPCNGVSPPRLKDSPSENAAITNVGTNFSASGFSRLKFYSDKKRQTNVQIPGVVPKFVKDNTEDKMGRRQLQAGLGTYGSDTLDKTFQKKHLEFVPVSAELVPPHSGQLKKTAQRKLAYSHDSLLEGDSDVESLLNRSQELQNQLRLSSEETDEYASLSPTYLPPSLQSKSSPRLRPTTGSIKLRTRGYLSQNDLSSPALSHHLNCHVYQSPLESSVILTSPMASSNINTSPNLACWSPTATCLTSPILTQRASSAQGTSDSRSSCQTSFTSPLGASPNSAEEWNARITHLMKSYGSQSSESKSHHGSSPGCDVCSSGTRTIRLIELLYGSDRDKLQEFVVKARWFTAWHAKIKRKKAWKKSIKVCIERADIFWRRILITRYFTQWQGSCHWKERLAVSVGKRRALQKGLNGLKWALHQSKDVEDVVVQRVKTLKLHCAFNEWRNQTEARRLNRLQHMFTKWLVIVAKKRHVKHLNAKATNHLLSKMYYQWKLAMYQTQSAGIADLHYKVTVLCTFFDTWRQSAKTAVSEREEIKTAILHYETNLYRTTFNQMKFTYTLHCVARSHHRKKTLLAAVCSWYQATRLTKMERPHQLSMARELRRWHLLKAAFSHWYQRLMEQRAEHHYKKEMLTNAFTAWQQTMKVRCEHDKLQEAVADRFYVKRALDQWRDKVRIQKDVHRNAALVLQRVWLKMIFTEWKYYASYQAELRSKMQIARTLTDTRTMKMMLDTWQRRFYSQVELEEAQGVWSHACARRAAQQWRKIIHIRKLHRLLEVSDSLRNQRHLVVYFSKWQTAQLRIRQLDKREVNVGRILSRSRLYHFFTTWRIRVKESHLIKPLRQRVQRKAMARAFDAWRAIVLRKKMVNSIRSHHDQGHVLKAFKIWRKAHGDIQQLIRARQQILLGVERRALCGLREVVCMKKKGKGYNQERLLRQAFLTWRNQFQERQEKRFAEICEKSRRCAVLSCYLQKWRQRVTSNQDEEEGIVIMVRQEAQKRIMRRCFHIWQRGLQLERLIRDFHHSSLKKLLKTMLNSWHRYAESSVAGAVHEFTLRMDGLAPLHSTGIESGCIREQSRSSTVASSGFHSHMNRVPHGGEESGTLGVPQHPCGGFFPSCLIGSPIVQVNLHSPDEGFEISIEVTPCDSDGSDEFLTPNGSPMKCDEIMFRSLTTERKETVEKIKSYRQALSAEQVNLQQEVHRIQARSCSRDLFPDDLRKLHDNQMRPERKNQRELLYHILLRWCNWPVSIAFEQWKEYVEMVKVNRSRIRVVGRQSQVLLKQRMFCGWKSQFVLSGRAEAHRGLVLKRHAFDALMMFTHLKKKQDGMQQIAAECYASAIICRSFSLWKDKAGRRLRWEQMLMYEDTPAACRVADAFQETVQNKHVRQCFLLWRERLRRVTIVRVYHQKDVMQRCLLGWHHWSASHSSQRLRWRQFRINSLLKQKFSTWRLRFSLMQETERRFQRCQKLKIQDMFERWHLWTAETKSRREIGLQLQKKFSLRKKARAFWSWKHTFLHHKKMDVFYHSHLVKRHLNGWRNYTDKRKDLQKKLDILAQRKLKRVTRFVFIQWRENHASAVELRLEEDRRLKQLTVKYYLKWRRCVMETRMVILYETNLMRRVFQAWSLQTRKGIQLAGVLRDALTMWRRRVTINRALHQASEEWLELHRYDRLEKTFACWMCKFRARVTAERHYEAVLQKRIFCHWVQHLKKQKELHKRAGNLVYRQQYRLIRCAFKRWTNCYDVICEQNQVLECHLEAKDVNTKRTILCSWHEMSLWRRAVRHCNMGLKKKQFTAWWSRTEGCLANKKKATEFRTEHDQVLLRNKFTVWQAETEQAQTAIVHYHKALEERVIKQWCSVIVKKKQLQILAAELQTTKSEKLVKISWEAWTGDWRRRIDLRERLDRLQDRLALRKQGTSFRIWRLKCIEVLRTKNYQKRVLQKYFRVWHCLTRQKREFNERVNLLEKKRQEYLQSVYGTIWKNRVQVTKFAVELAKHRFMETSWQRWRQALIREKGSQRFLELDNKLIVKETFDAWKQFVLHKKNDKAFKNHTDSGMVLDDPDTLSEVDTTQSSHRSSGFFSESDSELHAVHSSPSCLVLPGKLKFSS